MILSNPPQDYTYGKTRGSNVDGPICTLIVCPKTVVSNWISQIDEYVKHGMLRVVTYTGTVKQRDKIVDQVEDNEIDILLSSYETVAAEYEKERKGLRGIRDVDFHRIVLDEAQQIRYVSLRGVKNYW